MLSERAYKFASNIVVVGYVLASGPAIEKLDAIYKNTKNDRLYMLLPNANNELEFVKQSAGCRPHKVFPNSIPFYVPVERSGTLKELYLVLGKIFYVFPSSIDEEVCRTRRDVLRNQLDKLFALELDIIRGGFDQDRAVEDIKNILDELDFLTQDFPGITSSTVCRAVYMGLIHTMCEAIKE